MTCEHDWQVGRRRKGRVRYRCVKCAVWDNYWVGRDGKCSCGCGCSTPHQATEVGE